MVAQIRPALVMLALFTLLTGLAYPLAVTGFAQLAFPAQAQGNTLLIGQEFSQPGHFWGRLSATGPVPYNAGASSGSNLGPTAKKLEEAVSARIEALRKADPGNTALIPADLVTASGSGLDPHISPAAARYQAGRVARARGLDPQQVEALVVQHTEGRTLGILGEPRVNVPALNAALDASAAR